MSEQQRPGVQDADFPAGLMRGPPCTGWAAEASLAACASGFHTVAKSRIWKLVRLLLRGGRAPLLLCCAPHHPGRSLREHQLSHGAGRCPPGTLVGRPALPCGSAHQRLADTCAGSPLVHRWG